MTFLNTSPIKELNEKKEHLMNDHSQTSDLPVNFLLCSERSGSNLIRLMLDSHSQIHAPGPTHIGRFLIPTLSKYGDLSVDNNFRKLAEEVMTVFNFKYSYFSYSVTVDEIMENVLSRDFCAIYEYIFKKGMLLHGKHQLFIKENHNYRFVPYWLRYYPNAKFVFQVRDPRDFYLSTKNYRPFLTLYHTPGRTLTTWQTDQEQSLRILLELGPKRVFFQRYEDLISNPESVLHRLCEFLEVPFEKNMLDYHKNESANVDASARPGWRNLSKSIIQDNKEKYRKGLSRSEIIRIEHRLAPHMQIFNYPRSYEKVSVWMLAWSLIAEEGVRELLANIYRIWRNAFRRSRDIVLKLLKIGKGILN